MSRIPLLAAAALLPCASFAHNQFPYPHWCVSGSRTTLTELTIAGPVFADDVAAWCGPIERNCGEFHYERARSYVTGLCESTYENPNRAPGEIGDVIAVAVGPASFVAATHHTGYAVAQGITFRCVRCESVGTGPPTTPTPVP